MGDDFDFDFESFEVPDFDIESEPEVIDVSPVKPVEEMSPDEVDAEFNSLASLIDNDPDTIAAKAALLEAETVLNNVEVERAAKMEQYDLLAKQRAELEKQLAEIAGQMSTLNYEASSIRVQHRQAEDKRERARKELEIAQERIRVEYSGRQALADMDLIAKKCTWFTGAVLPDGKEYKIFPEQYNGAKFLATAKRCILGDGMGTGKSLQSIAALDLSQAKKVLIICQADITYNFEAEVRMWSQRLTANLVGMPKMQRNQMLSFLKIAEEICVIVNYEAWRKDLTLIERLISLGFDTVILDEAHNLKDTASIAYKGVKSILHTVNVCPRDNTVMPELLDTAGNIVKGTNDKAMARMCPTCGWSGQSYDIEGANSNVMTWDELEELKYWKVRSAERIWPMTGTPILNKPHDMYALLSLIDPLKFDNRNQFLRQYAEMSPYTGRWTFGEGGTERLFKRLRGKYLARTMEEMGIELPAQFPVIHDIDLDREAYALQAEVIDQITESAQIVLNSGKALPILAQIAIILRQRQANVWPGGISWEYVDPETQVREIIKVSEEVQESIKIDAATNIIAEAIERGERVVLFSQFKTALAELDRRLNNMTTESGQNIRAVRFDGDTTDDMAVQIKRNFDKKHGEEAKWDVVLANYKVGGTGLNFTAARRTVILDEEWNPGKRDQAYARTRRIGQDETTFVDVLRLNKTVDTWLSKLIEEKEEMIGGFDASAKDMQASWLDAFSKGDLKG